MKIEKDYYRNEWTVKITPEDIYEAEKKADGDYNKYYDFLFNKVMELLAQAWEV